MTVAPVRRLALAVAEHGQVRGLVHFRFLVVKVLLANRVNLLGPVVGRMRRVVG